MKYCPECEAEYVEGVNRCSDCDVPLIPEGEFRALRRVEEEERKALAGEEFVSVRLAENSFEADRLREALEQEGIPVVVRTFEDTAFDGLYVAQRGWGHVEVPASDKARAERIVLELAEVFPEPTPREGGAGEEEMEGGEEGAPEEEGEGGPEESKEND